MCSLWSMFCAVFSLRFEQFEFIHKCLHVCTSLPMYIHIHVYTNMHIHTYMHLYMYIYIYMCERMSDMERKSTHVRRNPRAMRTRKWRDAPHPHSAFTSGMTNPSSTASSTHSLILSISALASLTWAMQAVATAAPSPWPLASKRSVSAPWAFSSATR